jgi:phosphoglycolate phosphatase-like HAD superfamily hydrolase
MQENLDDKVNKALFWDFDGTLVHSGPLWSNVAFEVLKQNSSNSNITFDQIRSYMKIGFPWHTPEKDFTDITNDLWWEYMFEKFSNTYIKLGLKK